MSETSEIDETHSALEAVVSEEISAAEYQAMSGLLKPLAMQFYLERFPYLQMVDSASTVKDDVSKVAFERSDSEWLIHRYGDVAMSASAGEFLFTDGQSVDGMDAGEMRANLLIGSEVLSPVTLYAFFGKSLTFNVKNDKLEAKFGRNACLTIPELKWKHKLSNESEQTITLTPKKMGEFPIHDPAGNICGQLLVLEAPKPLPKRGTLMHQSDVTAKRMVQIAVERGWKGIVVAGGSQRMKLVAWIAAKALGMPIDGVDYSDDYEGYYERAMRYSTQRLEKLIKGTQDKKGRRQN